MNVLRKPVKDVDGFRFGGGNDVTVNVAGSADLRVSKVIGDDHKRRAVGDQDTCVCVPVGYNRAKSKISRGSWGFSDLSLFFFRKNGPEIGVSRGGQKSSRHIKDKTYLRHRRKSA